MDRNGFFPAQSRGNAVSGAASETCLCQKHLLDNTETNIFASGDLGAAQKRRESRVRSDGCRPPQPLTGFANPRKPKITEASKSQLKPGRGCAPFGSCHSQCHSCYPAVGFALRVHQRVAVDVHGGRDLGVPHPPPFHRRGASKVVPSARQLIQCLSGVRAVLPTTFHKPSCVTYLAVRMIRSASCSCAWRFGCSIICVWPSIVVLKEACRKSSRAGSGLELNDRGIESCSQRKPSRAPSSGSQLSHGKDSCFQISWPAGATVRSRCAG